MADSAVTRMKNLQIFLFCSIDVISIVLNSGILLLLLTSKKCRLRSSNKFFTSNIAFQLVTALTAVVFAVRFQENKAAELRKDTVIVQITFTLLGLGMSHFMLTIDRIITITMKNRYSLVLSAKQTWFMVGISWFIPTAVAIASAAIVTTGEPSNQVSYGLAILTAATGLTTSFALMGLNGYLLKKMHGNNSQPLRSTRRLRHLTVLANSEVVKEDEGISESRICIAMAVSYVALMLPQILFAFGKLLKTRGLLDMWYMQLACTLMLCSGVVDASLYIYMNASLRKEFRAKLRRIRNRINKETEEDEETQTMSTKDIQDFQYKKANDPKTNELLMPQDMLKKDIEVMLL